jgi:hypothetical protein
MFKISKYSKNFKNFKKFQNFKTTTTKKKTNFKSLVNKGVMQWVLYTDITCLGGVFAKNTSRNTKNEKISEPKGEGNLVSRLVYFASTPPKHDISV